MYAVRWKIGFCDRDEVVVVASIGQGIPKGEHRALGAPKAQYQRIEIKKQDERTRVCFRLKNILIKLARVLESRQRSEHTEPRARVEWSTYSGKFLRKNR